MPTTYTDGTPGWDRTSDRRIRSPLLYPLSYRGTSDTCKRSLRSFIQPFRLNVLNRSCKYSAEVVEVKGLQGFWHGTTSTSGSQNLSAQRRMCYTYRSADPAELISTIIGVGRSIAGDRPGLELPFQDKRPDNGY